jgi:hypothetical protein
LFTGVNDTAEKLFIGVNDTADKFIGGEYSLLSVKIYRRLCGTLPHQLPVH